MKKYCAEFFGTFWLVLGGCGTAVLAGDHVGWLGVALAFGLTVLTMAYAIGPISGCHLNPAVTVGLAFGRRMSPVDVIPYIVAQVLGACRSHRAAIKAAVFTVFHKEIRPDLPAFPIFSPTQRKTAMTERHCDENRSTSPQSDNSPASANPPDGRPGKALPLSRRAVLRAGVGSLCGLAGIGGLSAQQRMGGGGGRSGGGRGGGMGGAEPVYPREDNPAIQYFAQGCQRCGDCRFTCETMQTVKGFPNSENEESPCVYCGQCVVYCPNGAMTERFHFTDVARELVEKKKTGKILVAAIAPSVPISVGEMERFPVGTDLTAELVAGLRKIGFDYVFDTATAADLTVMEEASELVARLNNPDAGPLPLLTSCCPAHVRFLELFYRDRLPLLSTTKSPFLMLGPLVKIRLAEKEKIDPEKIVVVAIAPCTAKKAEILLPSANAASRFLSKPGLRDLDYALTTREAAYLLHGFQIDLASLSSSPAATDEKTDSAVSKNPSDPFDPLLGEGTGAGIIFGNTGGVTEALLRTTYRLLNDENPPDDFYRLEAVRGLKGTRTAEVDLKVRKLKIALVHGLGNARDYFDRMKTEKAAGADVIEVMACRGGCIGGGGQPLTEVSSRDELRKARIAGLYRRAEGRPIRLSGENPEVQKLYADFLEKPGSDRAKEILHRR